MNIASAINFALSFLNFGLMIWGVMNGNPVWPLSLGAAVVCLCSGIVCLD